MLSEIVEGAFVGVSPFSPHSVCWWGSPFLLISLPLPHQSCPFLSGEVIPRGETLPQGVLRTLSAEASLCFKQKGIWSPGNSGLHPS